MKKLLFTLLAIIAISLSPIAAASHPHAPTSIPAPTNLNLNQPHSDDIIVTWNYPSNVNNITFVVAMDSNDGYRENTHNIHGTTYTFDATEHFIGKVISFYVYAMQDNHPAKTIISNNSTTQSILVCGNVWNETSLRLGAQC